MTRPKVAILTALGAIAFSFMGTLPHVLSAFRGWRPFWSRFEASALALIIPQLPEVLLHSASRSITLLATLWFIVGALFSMLLLGVPWIRGLKFPQQVLAVVATPAVILPLLAVVAPFEPSF